MATEWALFVADRPTRAPGAKEGGERIEVARREQPLVVHRMVELLHVLLALEKRVGVARRREPGRLDEAARERMERQRVIGAQPLEHEAAVLGEPQRLRQL